MQGYDLIVFSSHPNELIRMVVDEFRERSGLRVHVEADGTGALLKRLRLGEPADLLWGGGAESLVANLDLFEPYDSPARAFIPATLRDQEAYWTGFTVLPMVIFANTRLVAPDSLPRGWRDLVSPALRGAVAYADPASSGSSYTILRTMLVAQGYPDRAEEAWRFIEGFVRAIGASPLKESALVFQGVASGEYIAGVSYENAGSDALRLGSDIALIYPEDGSSAVPDGIAIVRGAANRRAAEAFVDFALSQDVAAVMAANFKRRSSRIDAPDPEGLPPLSTIALVNYDFDAAVREREDTIERFQAIVDAQRP
jgi:iron(III) transport system substrate-binding protein